MQPEIILQKLYKGQYETLEVYKDGRIICDCLHGLFSKSRDINSECYHEKELRQAILKGNINNYIEV